MRQTLTSLRKGVDDLLLAVLTHLPDTVCGFDRLSPTDSIAATDKGRCSRALVAIYAREEGEWRKGEGGGGGRTGTRRHCV